MEIDYLGVFMVVVYTLNIDVLVIMYVIIFLKRKCDVFSAVSKLDDLILISIFQKSNFENLKTLDGDDEKDNT